MKAIKYTLILSFLLISCFSHAQKSENSKFVISNKLNIRNSPHKNGKIIGVLNNGECVETLALDKGEYSECETINNIYGCWTKIRHNKSIGYVFSAYLGSEYMLLYENSQIQYYPNVKHWYGIYYDSTSQKDVMVEIKTYVESKNHEDHENEYHILRTKEDRKSLFIIATNTKKEEKEIGLYTKNKLNFPDCLGYLTPGSKESLYFETINNTVSSECYYLIATGNYTMSDHGVRLSDYKLFIADNNPPKSRYTVIQELTNLIEFKEGFTFDFCGDIDGDRKPDLIIGGCSNNGCTQVLLLSSLAKENELLGLAAGYNTYDDC